MIMSGSKETLRKNTEIESDGEDEHLPNLQSGTPHFNTPASSDTYLLHQGHNPLEIGSVHSHNVFVEKRRLPQNEDDVEQITATGPPNRPIPQISFYLPTDDDSVVISHKGVIEDDRPRQKKSQSILKNKNRSPSTDGLASASLHVPLIRVSDEYDGKSKSDFNLDSLYGPSLTTLFKGSDTYLQSIIGGESKTVVQAPSSLLAIPAGQRVKEDTIMPTKAAESRWSTAFHKLSKELAVDERYAAGKVTLFDDEDEPSTDAARLSVQKDVFVTKNKLANAVKAFYTPFSYTERPPRKPNLAEKIITKNSFEKLMDEEGEDMRTPDYVYKFDPIPPVEWNQTRKTPGWWFGSIRKWNCPEPSPEHKLLPCDVDPLVKYKVERKYNQNLLHSFSKPSNHELERIQKDIELRVSPSGRKIGRYNSESEEEHVFKRVECSHDSDFDLLEPHIEIGDGPDKKHWPSPYLYYYNWKQTEDDVDEHIKASAHPSKQRRREIGDDLERDPMKVPCCRVGAEDTDASDSDDHKRARITNKTDPPTIRWKFHKAPHSVTDPLVKRYPYLYRHLRGKCFNNFYQFKRMHQAHKRKWYELFQQICGKSHSGCLTLTDYPLWYILWKKTVRNIVRKIPRKWKFPPDRKTETLFYGTMASIYYTQYIVEYDLLPNMDDPVWMSQLVLKKAMAMKDHFLQYTDDVSHPKVDYISLQRSKSYKNYIEWIGLLCRYQPVKMPPRVRKVFFINYFNVLSIQTQICRIPEKEDMKYLWEMHEFWGRSKGLAGYMELSLEEIFHGILRCNRIHPFKQIKIFHEDEHTKGIPKEMSLTRLSLDWFDPRIHFALNIGCKSCPPIQIFSLYEQDCQLDEVTRTYVRSRVNIDESSRTVTLPILFLWYEKDFGNNQRVLLWYLKKFLSAKDTLKIRRLVTSHRSITFRYERFDDELEHVVRRHPPTECFDQILHKKIIPLYWGNAF